MQKWQNELIQHGLTIDVMSDTKAKVINACHCGNEFLDDIITKENGYFVETFAKSGRREGTTSFNKISEYLGY